MMSCDVNGSPGRVFLPFTGTVNKITSVFRRLDRSTPPGAAWTVIAHEPASVQLFPVVFTVRYPDSSSLVVATVPFRDLPDLPEDVEDRLTEHGFVVDNGWAFCQVNGVVQHRVAAEALTAASSLLTGVAHPLISGWTFRGTIDAREPVTLSA